MNALAVIPARGGSKRIPGKNIRDFLGRPIISYSINAAQKSGLFDEIMVSTNNQKIAGIAETLGAKIPFLRTEGTADDYSPLAEVLIEVINKYHETGKDWNIIACLLPTAPFIRSSDLTNAYDLMVSTNTDAVLSVARFPYPIQRALRNDNGKISMFQTEHIFTRSQDLEPMYHDAGQFYFIKTKILLEERSLFCKDAAGYELDEIRVQDIDTESDWLMAEHKYKLVSSLE